MNVLISSGSIYVSVYCYLFSDDILLANCRVYRAKTCQPPPYRTFLDISSIFCILYRIVRDIYSILCILSYTEY